MSTSKLHRLNKNNVVTIADALFSATQQRLFTCFFMQPDRSFYARELIGLAKVGSGAVQRELIKLEACGLVTTSKKGNQKHYQANTLSPVFKEMVSLITKTCGISDKIREALSPLKKDIISAFIYGSIAKNAAHRESDVDIMVISDTLSLSDIIKILQPIESTLARGIGILLYTQKEFEKRKKAKDSFVNKVLSGEIIPLIGNLDDC